MCEYAIKRVTELEGKVFKILILHHHFHKHDIENKETLKLWKIENLRKLKYICSYFKDFFFLKIKNREEFKKQFFEKANVNLAVYGHTHTSKFINNGILNLPAAINVGSATKTRFFVAGKDKFIYTIRIGKEKKFIIEKYLIKMNYILKTMIVTK